ncbi:MAG: sugar phosphate isomerase/epimerase [Chloroflexota bacterium]
MKISFNTWVYSSFPVWLPAYTLEETIVRLSRIGYDGIEIGAASPHAYPRYVPPERRSRVKELLDANGLTVSSMLPAPGGGPGYNAASPLPEERQDTIQQCKDVVDLLADWGGTVMCYVAGWQVFGTSRLQAWEWSCDGLKQVARYAAGKNITICIEPTPVDSNLVEGADDAIEMMREVSEPNVKLMFDTYHVLFRKEVQTDYVYQMGNELKHIHLSDSDRLAPGQGTVDFLSLFQALKDVGFDGYLTMEIGFDKRTSQPDVLARDAYEYVSDLGKQVGL